MTTAALAARNSAATARVVSAARLGVRRVEARAPELCGGWRVRIARLAERLGIAIAVREDLGVPARWRRERPADHILPLWSEGSHGIDVIDIRPGLSEPVRRFALAHEIGHAILYREFLLWAHRLSVYEREVFANAFAVELLVPRAARAELAERLRVAERPVEFLRLADGLGVSPRTLFRFAARHGWMGGAECIWLDIRSVPNRHTGRDRRLRIFDTVLDRDRWFVPSNRSVAGAFGSDEWLLGLTRGVRCVDLKLDVSRRTGDERPRYLREAVPVSVSALRLHQAGGGHGMEILVRAAMRGG